MTHQKNLFKKSFVELTTTIYIKSVPNKHTLIDLVKKKYMKNLFNIWGCDSSMNI